MRPLIKALLLLLVLLTGVAVIHLTPIRHFLKDVHSVSNQIRSMGWWAPTVFTAALVMLVSVGVPRLLLCPIGGMAFGFTWGLIWSQIGTIIGYYLTFLFVRWSGQEFILNKWPRLNVYDDFFKAKGILVVLLIRQLPVPGFYINMILGLTHIRHVNFLLGTLVGILPAAIPATLIGAGIIALSPWKSIAAISLAVVFLVAASSFAAWYFRCLKLKISSTAKSAD